MPIWVVRWLHRRRLSRRGLRGSWVHRTLGDRVLARELWKPTRGSMARAWLIGFPITVIPFLPIQSLISSSIALFFRANILLCLALQFLSNPFTAPVHLPACYVVGRAIEGDSPVAVWREVRDTDWTKRSSFRMRDVRALFSGAVVIGVIGGVSGYFLIMTMPLPKRRRKLPPIDLAD